MVIMMQKLRPKISQAFGDNIVDDRSDFSLQNEPLGRSKTSVEIGAL